MTEYIINPDVNTYVDLWLDMVKELKYGEDPNRDWFIEQMKSLQETDKFIVVSAIKDGETIGFCDVFLSNDAATGKVIGYGMHLFMKPEHREGVETDTMFRKMEALSYEQGANIIQIQCYPEKRRFWERQDFKHTQFIMRRY
jgi:hypothetical protein